MTPYDYGVLAFYFVYLLAIGWVFRRFIRNVSDYFRSGGQVMWWMAGGSAFMMSFSAWTFTGAASRAYADGWPIMMLYVANAVGFLFNAAYFAPRFRQLRVVTSMQAVRLRFGPGSEQFFTWLTLPVRTFYAGIWLYGLGVFFSAVFGFSTQATIVVAGGTVMVVALLSGSWAVVASDFIQVLILMPVTLVATVFAIAKLGGPAQFWHQLAPTHLNGGKLWTEDFLAFWCVAMLLKQFISTNNLTEAYRYLCVKDSAHARKAALLAAGLMLVGIVIWFAPPMAAAVAYPDLRKLFEHLQHPGEGSFFAIALGTFPVGMIGLLVSGIFATTMSAMDGGLNSNAGIFIKNFYQPVLRPGGRERELLLAGKGTTVVLGLIIILIARAYSRVEGLSLFSLMLDYGILVGLPQSIPLVLGIFIRRTPSWAGWTTVVLGFTVGYATRQYLTVRWAKHHLLNADHGPLSAFAGLNWDQGAAVFTVVTACTAWFCFSRWFYRSSPAEYQASVDEFSRRMNTPVDYAKEESAPATDGRQSRLIGWLCVPYGAMIMLLALIPNPVGGRCAFLFCGAVLTGVGTLLIRSNRSHG